jgi:hypothetical protein
VGWSWAAFRWRWLAVEPVIVELPQHSSSSWLHSCTKINNTNIKLGQLVPLNAGHVKLHLKLSLRCSLYPFLKPMKNKNRKQFCRTRTIMLCCGTGSDFGKVFVPVPDPDTI